MGVLEHLGIAQAPASLFAAELREGTVIRLVTAFERTVPILAVRPASRRMSTKVRIFIEHLEKTSCFVLNSIRDLPLRAKEKTPASGLPMTRELPWRFRRWAYEAMNRSASDLCWQ